MVINPRDNVEVREDGHKYALRDIASGENVIKYGMPIGHATAFIKKGEHVHSHNLATNLGPQLDYVYEPEKAAPFEPEAGAGGETFLGYRRSGGRVGVRNEIWVVATVGCVNALCERLAASCGGLALTHPYGCSQLGDDHETTANLLAALCCHPNAGGVLVVGLGCENNTLDSFKSRVDALASHLVRGSDSRGSGALAASYTGAAHTRGSGALAASCTGAAHTRGSGALAASCGNGLSSLNIRFMRAQDPGDEFARGMELIAELQAEAANAVREPIPVSELKVGLKCGGSDGFSGLTANPLVGHFSDWLAARGGSTVLTEVPEMFGAEALLMNRCRDRATFDKFVKMINGFKAYYESHGQPCCENPSPGNKAGGITTLEDKSLGCVQKGGTSPVNDVLGYGEQVKEHGLSLITGPGNDLVAATVLAAAGCHLILFTTGRGTPFGTVVPTMKVATNSTLAKSKPHWVDWDAMANPDVEEFARKVLAVASGELAANERNNARGIAIFKDGVTL